VGILITLLVSIITLYFGATNLQIGLLLLIAIYFFIVTYYIANYIEFLIKKKIEQINKNSEDINIIRKELNEVKKNMDLHLEISKIKAKVEAMDKSSKKRKGTIDPRIVIILIT